MMPRLMPPLGPERSFHEPDFVLARGVVRVDQRGRKVTVPHPSLERPKRNAGGRHASAERMPQVVKTNVAKLRIPRRPLEPLQQLRAVERQANLRVRNTGSSSLWYADPW